MRATHYTCIDEFCFGEEKKIHEVVARELHKACGSAMMRLFCNFMSGQQIPIYGRIIVMASFDVGKKRASASGQRVWV